MSERHIEADLEHQSERRVYWRERAEAAERERDDARAALREARTHLRPEVGGRFDQRAAVAVIDAALPEAPA